MSGETLKASSNNNLVISDSGLYDGFSNGSIRQTVFFKYQGQNYKIEINSESVVHQSYSRLYKWTEVGFSLITDKNPVIFYNINFAYNKDLRTKTFEPIINDLIKLTKEMF